MTSLTLPAGVDRAGTPIDATIAHARELLAASGYHNLCEADVLKILQQVQVLQQGRQTPIPTGPSPRSSMRTRPAWDTTATFTPVLPHEREGGGVFGSGRRASSGPLVRTAAAPVVTLKPRPSGELVHGRLSYMDPHCKPAVAESHAKTSATYHQKPLLEVHPRPFAEGQARASLEGQTKRAQDALHRKTSKASLEFFPPKGVGGMPWLAAATAPSARRCATVFFCLTDDRRYRGGVPAATPVTWRKSDPVARGAAMRRRWESDRFLARQQS